MEETHFDLIVIGGGPGGYVGAIRAAQLGMNVACIEREALGGICLNWGCIPTKALLKNAELYEAMARRGSEFGLEFDGLRFDWSRIIGRSRDVTGILSKGVAGLLRKNKITHLAGHARIVRGRTPTLSCEVQVQAAPDNDQVIAALTARNVLIATGSGPRELPCAGFDGRIVISSREAMILPAPPKRMVIVGGGAIGVEFAYFFNAFGTQVTIVEMLDHLLPIEDADISRVLQREFKKSGITSRTGFSVAAIDREAGDGAKVQIVRVGDESQSESIAADVVLVAVGVRGNYDGLFDTALGLETIKDHIKVQYRDVENPTYETSVSGVYAVGDVIGPPWLAHVASEEAVACVERMAGHDCTGVNYGCIPGCTYCHPEVASVGRTEQQLQADGLTLGRDYSVGKHQLRGHGKAIATGGNVGLVKILAGIPHGEILGAHIVGEHATELIGEFTLARSLEATVQDIIDTVHAHPTMHEAIHEAALASQGRIIHG